MTLRGYAVAMKRPKSAGGMAAILYTLRKARGSGGYWRMWGAREAPIRAGNVAMYYPEANTLVPRIVDPRSRTPAFKDVRVRVARSVRLKVGLAR